MGMTDATRDEYAEMYEIRMRGAAAAMFMARRMSPGKYWPVVKGISELTLRDIGEIGFISGYEVRIEMAPQVVPQVESDE
jgi:hypothetical protein